METEACIVDERHGIGRKGRWPRYGPCRFLGGFTLTELVATLVIVGIMAVVIVPRFADVSVFESRGFRDESLAFLRWAQKSAVAQRRTVCVYFTATDAWAHIRSLPPDLDPGCGVSSDPAAAPPAGQVWLSGVNGNTARVRAPDNTGYVAPPASFQFDALGEPSQRLDIAVQGSSNLVVEAVTGYVH